MAVRLFSCSGSLFAGCLPVVSGFATVDCPVRVAVRSNRLENVVCDFLGCVATQMLKAPTPTITARANNEPVEDVRDEDREDDRFGERDDERVLRFLVAI